MKKTKETKPRKDFSQRLADKLRSANIGEVEEDSLCDNSSRWVKIKQGDYGVEISFDMKGETITDILVFKDVWEVVDETIVARFK